MSAETSEDGVGERETWRERRERQYNVQRKQLRRGLDLSQSAAESAPLGRMACEAKDRLGSLATTYVLPRLVLLEIKREDLET